MILMLQIHLWLRNGSTNEFKYLNIETIYICVGHVAGIVGQHNDEMYLKNLTMGMNLIDGIK